MKTIMKIMLLLLITATCFAQQNVDTLHSQVFSFSPVSRKVNKVNGMALGIGHAWSEHLPEKINGLNVEVNPLTPLILLFQDPDRVVHDSLQMTVSGLHLSAGGFSGKIKLNGAGISVYNIVYATNGFSITGLYNISTNLNGLHISGLSNSAEKARGLLIAGINTADDFSGARVGVLNESETTAGLDIGLINLNEEKMRGLQIGIFNKTGESKGFQIGLWNINSKRSLPFFNWHN